MSADAGILLELSERCEAATDLCELHQAGIEALSQLAPDCRVTYNHLLPDGTLEIQASSQNEVYPKVDGVHFDLNLFPAQLQAVRAEAAVFVEDVRKSPRTSGRSSLLEEMKIAALCDLPAWRRGKSVGFFGLHRAEAGPWPDHQRRLVRAVARMVGGHIDRRARSLRDAAPALSMDNIAEERLAILDLAERSLMLVDAADVVRYANAAACRLCGLKLDETINSTIEELFPPELARRVERRCDQVRREGRAADFSLEIETSQGTRAIRVAASPVPGEGRGQVQLAMMDIAEERLREERRQHAQRIEIVGRLSAGVAHNFNNMLMGILPNLEALEDYVDLAGAGRRHLEQAQWAAIQAAELVAQLGMFARGRNARELDVVDLALAVEHTAEMCRVTFDRRHTIEVELPSDLPCVRANPQQLEQALLNLCLNARDALEQASISQPRIELRGSRVGAPANAEEDDPQDWVRIQVLDNGPGMSEPVRSQIFDPFFTTKEDGTGLGLATVHAIVEELGGALDVTSIEGEGSCFTMVLPATDKRPVPVPVPSPTDAFAGDETILIIDDEELVRDATRWILESAGYTVWATADGESGLARLDAALAEQNPPDLVLLDLSMPGLPGRETLLRLRLMAPKLRVIILTGYVDTPPIPAPVSAIMEKPAGRLEMLEVVRRVLDGDGLTLD